MKINEIITITDERLRLITIRESGINTFEVIDEQGKRIVTYNGGLIDDHGIRVINTNEL